jgi:aldehyde dehydrogenase (NAD+)
MKNILEQLNISSHNHGMSTGQHWLGSSGESLISVSPVDGQSIASVFTADRESYDAVVSKAEEAFTEWRKWPAPKRGDIVRQISNQLRLFKEPLGKLVSWEMGKSLQEGLGEVQEMIDICDFAVGLSRQLYGLTMHSERPGHRMYEQWHPLGITGVISAFNFPVAVWSWNAALAWVCGDVCVWKPSEKTPLCAIACQKIIAEVFRENQVPEGVSCVIIGGRETGEWLANDHRIPLISATGSTRMGKAVGAAVGARLGRSLLELGGNNAIIITADADLDIAVIGSVFGAVGTAGQRCTSTRRLIIHESVYDAFRNKLVQAYKQLKIGDPLDPANHVGPLIDTDAVRMYQQAVDKCRAEGGVFVVEPGLPQGRTIPKRLLCISLHCRS